MAPPQDTVSGEAAFRSLSDVELAREWSNRMRAGEDTRPVLDEFSRRFWDAQEEAAELSTYTTIAPWDAGAPIPRKLDRT